MIKKIVLKDIASYDHDGVTFADLQKVNFIYKKEDLKPNERIRFFMSRRKTGEYFTKMEYVEAFEKKPSKGTAQNDLLLMLKLGLCEKEGDGPSTKYRWN
jgi:hypothetical protein